VSESGATGCVVPAPPGTRTWIDGRDPVTVRCLNRGPAVDFEGAPEVPAEVDGLSVDCADEPDDADPESESSATATPGLAATAHPIPSANAAEPTRTPNPAASMTPPS